MVADASSAAVRPARKALVAKRPRVQSYRFVRAYLTTFQVLFAYLRLSLGRRIFGVGWYEDRIGDVHRRNAVRVERTIVKLQGLFIKVGQLLSIMANFLPEQFRAGLEGLQDQVPPRPFEDIEDRILADLGRPVAELFLRFDPKPLASASLGQVHEAYLQDGTRVAVKVQHRDIDEVTRLDLKTIRRIMAIVQMFVPVRGLDAYYHQVRQMIAEELDFQREAGNIERLSRNFKDDARVVFPRVVPSHSTRQVLTTTFVEGVKVGDTAAIDAAGIDRKELARKIVRTYCQMMFVDGIYHADPHPGNMLARADGSLVLLDFGAVAELSPSMREGIPEFLEGVIRRDTHSLIKALKKMGFLARADDGEVSEKVIDYFHRRFQEEVKLESFNLKDIKIDPLRGFENLLDLRRMNIGLRELSEVFHIPRDWVLLERTILLLTGVCTQLDPDMSPMEVVNPYLQEFVLGERDWTKIALEAAKDMALQAVTLPEDLRKYLNRAVRGDLEVKVRGLSDGARLVYAAVRQAVYAAGAMTAAIAALALHITKDDHLATYCLYGAAAMALLFVLSALFTRTRPR
ncbi:MAG TPA: AarF/UbiB family protein [Polyangiaceae bacterium]|nr:AarF/UbiB family protein [Polyangiaceae bacterium]